jgi:hypothetical protein
MTLTQRLLLRARSQEGVTIVIAMGVMLVTSLMLAGAFVATQDDVGLSHTDTMQKQAYYAALAGVQEFEYQMQSNPNYWQTCPKTTNPLPQEKVGSYQVTPISYKVTILPAAGASECSKSNPIGTVIESKGAAANTFRIESLGTAGVHPEEHHTIIATFKVTGFLNFIYYTNHEDEDPSLYNASATCTNPNTFYPSTSGCQLIEFATGDAINGPVHTNDAACVGGSASFGLKGHSPPNVVEFYLGVNSNCNGTGTYYTATKSYIKGEDLPPPTSDSSLETYAAEEYKFSGVTDLVLEGATNEIAVTNASVNGGVTKKYLWPSNGLIYVKQSSGSACGYTFKPYEADNGYEAGAETNCGNVYVHGTYSKPLTIGSSDDLIINGEIYPYGDKGGTPTGTATLGLIANNFVRVYHPVKQTYEGSGPELETAHNLRLESAAHKEIVTVTAVPGLGEELKLEVKNSGSQFEVLIYNESGKVVEKAGPYTKASQLVGLASSYVEYSAGAKYSEGATEKLKALGGESLGHPEVIRIKPKSPNLGKEMKVEVKENAAGTENEVILLNAEGKQLEKITGIKEAKSLLRSTTYAVYEKGNKYNSTDEKEKLRVASGSWLDETCKVNGKQETEKFNTSLRECEYTDTSGECDAPSLNESEDTLHGWGTLENPWIYAAILATTHSFVVDNVECGKPLGELHLDGALAQNYRGIVGTGGTTINTGYLKDYKYDERLAVDEPPYFLSPLNAGWKVARETSPTGG